MCEFGREAPGAMKLSVIVPVYNEEDTITVVLDRLAALDVGVPLEIVVVDDGSTDATSERIRVWVEGRANVAAAFHEANRGKGAAIRTGLECVTGDVVVIQDADLEYDPADFARMLDVIRDGAEAVYGSRVLARQPYQHLRYYLGGRLVSLVTNLLYRTGITDEPTCYKMIRSDLLRALGLVSEGFEFCPEVTSKLARAGVAIREIPISYHPRSMAQGKKIRWHDGLQAIWVLARNRLGTPRMAPRKPWPPDRGAV